MSSARLFSNTYCRYQHQKRDMEDEVLDAGSEEKLGEEFSESEGSDYGGQMEGGVNDDEEASVRGPAEEALHQGRDATVEARHQGSGACKVCSCGGRLSRCEESLPTMVEQEGCMNKGRDEKISEEDVSKKKKGNVASRSPTTSGRFEEVYLIVTEPIKAQKREGVSSVFLWV